MTLTTIVDTNAPTAISEANAMIALIEKLTVTPSADIGKLEKLMDMHRELLARRAATEFTEAMLRLQAQLPTIQKNGTITITDKNNRERVIQSTPYALWEDIHKTITPMLLAEGFVLTFRNGLSDDGRVKVTGMLKHRGGHIETTEFILPHDSTGSKNAVQAIGSSTSYGHRYATTALLNLRFGGLDDDGKAGGVDPNGFVSDEQAQTIRDRLRETGATGTTAYTTFLTKFAIDSIEELPAAQYQEALGVIEARAKRARELAAQRGAA